MAHLYIPDVGPPGIVFRLTTRPVDGGETEKRLHRFPRVDDRTRVSQYVRLAAVTVLLSTCCFILLTSHLQCVSSKIRCDGGNPCGQCKKKRVSCRQTPPSAQDGSNGTSFPGLNGRLSDLHWHSRR